ncbi:calcium-binding protein [Actinoplanes sp. NPDC048796]|uniref:calcium-binding protein n=1 Tax=Actinoplanes sp. NPDC048796 TaxID=3155640 RepID=UPI0033F7AA0C
MRRLAATVIGGAAVAASVMVAPPADAAVKGKVYVVGKSIVALVDTSSRAHNVSITRSGRTIVVDDVVGITAGAGCAKVDGTKVRCALKVNPSRIRVQFGPKNDTLVNRTDVAITVRGGAGADRITGGSRADLLEGDAGNDAIWGLGGNDTVEGRAGNDTVSGGDGNDSVRADEGNDTLYGGNGHDVMDDGFGTDRVYGGNGNDMLYADRGNDTYDAGPGDDQIRQEDESGAPDADNFIGGTGHDYVSYEMLSKPIVADADGVRGDDGRAGEHDTISTSVEGILGGYGNDRLTGTARRDWLDGGPGNDVIGGGAGDDILSGGPGRDYVSGATGNDLLHGDEWLDMYPVAADTLLGGPGRDTVDYSSYTRPLTIDLDGAAGDDGQAGERDTVGADVEDVVGGAGSDRITGNAAANTIDAGGGNNVVRGGAGNDVISAFDGLNYIGGDAGDDQITTYDLDRDDHVDAGTGTGDRCTADLGDAISKCETVDRY